MASNLVDEKITHNSKSMDPEVQDSSHGDAPGRTSDTYPSDDDNLISTPQVPLWRIVVSLILLLLNYFLAQYDKFILSYFQDSVVSSLDLSLSEYGIISGYATGIVYALLALPMAFVADYTSARLWVLSIAAVWWSLCAIFQGFSHSFVQLFLARIGMGIGQAAVEPLSVSLISDMLGKDYVFIGESVLYVGVYIGEAISGQIATAFTKTNTPWSTAMKAIGIVGIVIAILLRLLIREPRRQTALVTTTSPKLHLAKQNFLAVFSYIIRMRSFWLLTFSASLRQLAGNVFGYYMPAYLSTLYPSQANILSNYGIIVGAAGSVAVLSGGLLTKLLWPRTNLTPLYLTAIGGMISSLFVLLMIFSLSIADGSQIRGVKILYGTMSLAYLTAELWLGALNALIALLLPPRYKTFGLAIWASTQVLVYSSGPEIIGLALRNVESGSVDYLRIVKIALAAIICVGYWACGIGLLAAVPLVRRDLQGDFVRGKVGRGRKIGFAAFGVVLVVMVVVLFVCSIVYR